MSGLGPVHAHALFNVFELSGSYNLKPVCYWNKIKLVDVKLCISCYVFILHITLSMLKLLFTNKSSMLSKRALFIKGLS